MRLPNANDLKSDTVKTGSITSLLSAVIAFIQFLHVMGIIDKSVADKALLASPFIGVFGGYLAAYYRVNIKTNLDAP